MSAFAQLHSIRYVGISLFTLFHIPIELRQKAVNQKGEKNAIIKGDRTRDPSVIVQCATNYATTASSLIPFFCIL